MKSALVGVERRAVVVGEHHDTLRSVR
jgi:hypothetical protein